MITIDINERIFSLLHEQNKTANGLSEYIGVKPSSISAWKNSGSYPSSKYVVRISEYLNVSPTYLLTGEIEKPNINEPQQMSDSERKLYELVHPLNIEEQWKVVGAVESYLGVKLRPPLMTVTQAIQNEAAMRAFRSTYDSKK